jgi:6-phosphogluconate dehydrogenase
MKFDIAVIGLSTMGGNLARNIANNGYKTAVYNRSHERTDGLIANHGSDNLQGFYSIEELVVSLSLPRKIIIMVKAGEPVDKVIESIIPFLDKEDIIVDCGNSYYEDTVRREKDLKEKGFRFIGCGVSGGEEGALNGPSIMPGGDQSAWKELKNILEAISAEDFSGGKCVTYIGNDGAGHYVKMVHNGIEYGVMQMMAEGYDLIRKLFDLNPEEIADIFAEYNKGKLKSYLFDIAGPVLSQKDDLSDDYLIDQIMDKAGQKGTGMWTAIEALKRGVALPSITESVFARVMSSEKDKRTKLSELYPQNKSKFIVPLKDFKIALENALYAGMLSSYAQGYDLIQKASDENNWGVDLSELSRIWQGGCIIRAEVLKLLASVYSNNKKNINLLEIPEIVEEFNKYIGSLRGVVANAAIYGIPAPSLTTSLTYFDYMTQKNSSANLIQGLRDYFGAHTYKRVDRDGDFHTDWN